MASNGFPAFNSVNQPFNKKGLSTYFHSFFFFSLKGVVLNFPSFFVFDSRVQAGVCHHNDQLISLQIVRDLPLSLRLHIFAEPLSQGGCPFVICLHILNSGV